MFFPSSTISGHHHLPQSPLATTSRCLISSSCPSAFEATALIACKTNSSNHTGTLRFWKSRTSLKLPALDCNNLLISRLPLFLGCHVTGFVFDHQISPKDGACLDRTDCRSIVKPCSAVPSLQDQSSSRRFMHN